MNQPRNQKPVLTIPVDPVASQTNVPTAARDSSDENSVLIEVPIYRPGAEVDFPLHIDVRLTREQSHVLRKATTALDRQQARLRCGKRVVNPTDAVKYILELLHKSL